MFLLINAIRAGELRCSWLLLYYIWQAEYIQRISVFSNIIEFLIRPVWRKYSKYAWYSSEIKAEKEHWDHKSLSGFLFCSLMAHWVVFIWIMIIKSSHTLPNIDQLSLFQRRTCSKAGLSNGIRRFVFAFEISPRQLSSQFPLFWLVAGMKRKHFFVGFVSKYSQGEWIYGYIPRFS